MTNITRRVLKNGVKLISHNQPSHCASIGVFINASTRNDVLPGTSHFLSKMAFSSTVNHTASELQQSLELIGGNVTCQAGLESIHYTASLFKHDIPRAIELIAAIAQTPLFTAQEVDSTRKTISYELESLADTPETIQEQFLALAYSSKTVGKTVRDTNVTAEALHLFRGLHYTPRNISLSAVGVDPDFLQEHAEINFGSMQESSSHTDYRSQLSEGAVYKGGLVITDTTDTIIKNPDNQKLTHVYIGFEGLSMADPDIYSLAVLSSMLGGGGSFSAGGPGKGMYTRLYKNILNKHYWVETSNHFNHTFQDSGVFGMYCSIIPGRETHQAVAHVMCEQLLKCTQKIGTEELMRAKNMLKSMILMGGENQLTQVQDMGRQYLMFDGMVTETTSCERIDEVTADDIKRVARRVILGSDEASRHDTSYEDDGRFKYDDGIMKAYERTGSKEPTVLVSGPMMKNDPLLKVKDVLTSWGIGFKQKKGLFSAML